MGSGNFFGKRAPVVKNRDSQPWAVQKRLSRSRCRFGRWVGWTHAPGIRWGSDPSWGGAILRGKGKPQHAQLHSDMKCAKTAEPIKIPFVLWTRVGPRKHCPFAFPCEGAFLGKGHARACLTTLCGELCKNSSTDRDVVWVVDSRGPKDACVTWGRIGASWLWRR